MWIGNSIFISQLQDNEQFMWFCEITSDLDENIVFLKDNILLNFKYVMDDIFEINLSDIKSIEIWNINKKILIIKLDKLDDRELLNLNFYREKLVDKFEKILIISNSKEISNRFFSVSKDLFSWIQYHFRK